LNASVVLEDEALRDGLQAESIVLETAQKLHFFELLVKAGFKRIQAGSFVHPKVVPQMADSDELIKQVKDTPGVLLTGLILNRKGLERALDCGLGHVSMSASVSDAHSRRNVKRPAQEAIADMVGLIKEAAAAGMTVRAGAQCAFGCVYQGAVDPDFVLATLKSMAAAGASEVNLADTTGMAHPAQVSQLVERVRQELPELEVSLHLHDTRGLGMANLYAGWQAGAGIFDVATGGLGGCPFVKGAAGNLPAEDVVNLMDSMGVETGLNLEALCEAVKYLGTCLGRQMPGRMCRVIESLGHA
jgi:hydroxymethylglutaryl-CoA lyase